MISVIGRVIDDANQPITSVKVIALADWLLTDKPANAVKVDGAGQFVLEVESIDPADAAAISPVVPSLRVRVVDRVSYRLIRFWTLPSPTTISETPLSAGPKRKDCSSPTGPAPQGS
jgi:hypothetical protein